MIDSRPIAPFLFDLRMNIPGCDELFQGPYEVFWDVEWYVDECAITLHSCTTFEDGEDVAEIAGDAKVLEG